MLSLDGDDPAEPTPPTIITVNAGGKLFQTYRETLTRGSGYFQAYFEGKFAKPDPRETIFLDMDEECFRHLLLKMRLPEYVPSSTIPGIRSAAAFLGMELPQPPSPEEIQRETQRLECEQAKQDVFDLAVRLCPGDRLEQKPNGDDWRMVTFEGYDALNEFPWRFTRANIRYLWFDERVWIRVTDPTERAKILARDVSDPTRVVFAP